MRDSNFTSGPFYLNAAGTFGTIPNDGMQSVIVTVSGTWTDGKLFVYGYSNAGRAQLYVPNVDPQSNGITVAGVYSIPTGGFMDVRVERQSNGTPSGTPTVFLSSSPDIAGAILGA